MIPGRAVRLSPISKAGAARPHPVPATAALLVLACCALTACGSNSAPGARPTHTVTVQASATTTTPAGGTTPSTPATGPAAGPTGCLATALRGSIGPSSGAAGTTYQYLTLTNTSAAACSLYGYPGVSFVTGPGGSEVGAPATRNSAFPTSTVTLAPGGQASVLIGLLTTGVYPPSDCQPTSVSWLRVYPPGDYSSIYVQFAAQTCASPAKVMLTVTAVRVGQAS